jgi:hypothetical protein
MFNLNVQQILNLYGFFSIFFVFFFLYTLQIRSRRLEQLRDQEADRLYQKLKADLAAKRVSSFLDKLKQ